ncbi:TPA: transposase [Escherichia coli]|nr:transposase [Escherichia coli]
MDYRVSGLNLVVNSIILWSMVCLSQAVDYVRGQYTERALVRHITAANALFTRENTSGTKLTVPLNDTGQLD